MRLFTFIFSFLFLISCSNPSSDKTNVTQEEIKTDTTPVTKTKSRSAVRSYRLDTLITERLLLFADYLDSVGYSDDSIRLKKTYGLQTDKCENVYGHYFYPSNETNSNLHLYYQNLSQQGKLPSKWEVDKKKFENALSIYAYYFTEKNPTKSRGVKLVVDGFVEEWKFRDNNSAKLAALELNKNPDEVFFNIGAFICYVDNYMYVFSTRASGFMYSIRPLFNKFTSNKRITVMKSDWH